MSEPLVRGTAFVGLVTAAREAWGERGLGAIGSRLDDETRRAVLGEIVVPTAWVPERYVVSWCEAVWRGPAAEAPDVFTSYVARSIALGFTRFRRALLSLATPSMLAARAGSLWRKDHTHGELAIEVHDGIGIVRLSDHPYVESTIARWVIAESFRSIVAELRGVGTVTETHALERPKVLAIRLEWDPRVSRA